MTPTPNTLLHPSVLAQQGGDLVSGVSLLVVGMAVVFLALATLWGVIALISRLAPPQPHEHEPHRAPAEDPTLDPDLAPPSEPAPAVAPAPVPVAAAPQARARGPIDPAHLVVIAAAVAARLARPHRVRRVVIVGRLGNQGAWVSGGRASIMGSHRPHLHKGTPTHRRPTDRR